MKVSVSRFELSVVSTVLNAPGGGSTIQDLRNVKKTLAYLKSLDTPDPVRPESPKPPEGATEPTEEQKKSWVEEAKAWSEAMKAKVEEELEVVFTPESLALIKNKLATFKGFYSDESSREKILSLAEKLGV